MEVDRNVRRFLGIIRRSTISCDIYVTTPTYQVIAASGKEVVQG
jgi:hypothetical protein